MPNKVLFVDDENNILNTIRRQFRNFEHELLFASSGEEGLEILKEEKVSVIVSDMRMHGMDGSRFLELAKEICPDCVKMVLSGHAEIDTVLNSVNRGNIWRFITKPWEKEELKIAIYNAIELYESRKKEKDLIASLKLKTQELNELNKNLDKKVKERTWLLNERSEILNMILEEPDINRVIFRICDTLSAIVGQDIIIIAQDEIYSNNPEVKVYKYNKEHFRQIICKDKKELAQLIIQKKYCKEINGIEDIVPVLKLAIQYKLTIEKSPEILSNIDKFMDSL